MGPVRFRAGPIGGGAAVAVVVAFTWAVQSAFKALLELF
jgi:hypothetical protein